MQGHQIRTLIVNAFDDVNFAAIWPIRTASIPDRVEIQTSTTKIYVHSADTHVQNAGQVPHPTGI